MRSTKSRRERLARVAAIGIVSIALAMMIAPAAFATNGYLIHGIGTRAKGLAGAGAALPGDALGSNPAGMAWVGKRFDAGLLFQPEPRVQDYRPAHGVSWHFWARSRDRRE